MAGFRLPGLLCVVTNSLPADTGTLIRGASPPRASVGMGPDAGTLGSGPTPGQTFDTAIELFANSPQSSTPVGKRILAKLQETRRNNLLSFADIGPAGDSSRESGTIRITKVYERDPIKTSIWLVHEAYHLAVAKDDLLYADEEVESRRIQGEYWIFLEDTGVRLQDGIRYRLAPQDSPLPKAYRADRIIDWVIPMYVDEKAFKITADWIVKHKGDWGGLCNRTLDTRKFYAKILADSQPTFALDPRSIDPQVAETLLELLECNPFEAGSIATHAGKGDVKTIVEKLPATFKTRVDTLKKNALVE